MPFMDFVEIHEKNRRIYLPDPGNIAHEKIRLVFPMRPTSPTMRNGTNRSGASIVPSQTVVFPSQTRPERPENDTTRIRRLAMAERNLGEPQHGINIDSPDNIVQTAGKGAAETAGYTKAEQAKMPVPKVGDKDLRTKNDFNIEARNMNETLRGNHTATVTGSETRTVTGAATQTTTGPVKQQNDGGKTTITNEYDNSVVLGAKDSLTTGAFNNVVLGEALEAVAGLATVLIVAQYQKIGYDTKDVENAVHNFGNHIRNIIHEINTGQTKTDTINNHIITTKNTMANHGLYCINGSDFMVRSEG